MIKSFKKLTDKSLNEVEEFTSLILQNVFDYNLENVLIIKKNIKKGRYLEQYKNLFVYFAVKKMILNLDQARDLWIKIVYDLQLNQREL